MAKAPPQSNTQLGISEQTAREFKRIAEQEEKAGTESWNDGEYDSAADHFERAANTLRKYAGNDLALVIELYKRMCGVYLPALESYQPAFLPR